MKRSRFTEHQIVQILKQVETGMKTADLCRQHGISETTFYNWKAKYGGMESSDVKRLRELETGKSISLTTFPDPQPAMRRRRFSKWATTRCS